MKIAILGGTGKEGKGLAYRWLKAGHTVIIGSRSAEKAQAAAAEIGALLERQAPSPVQGLDNPAAAAEADVVVLTVPYMAQATTLEAARAALADKVVVITTVPLDTANVRRVHLLPGGSASAEAQQQLPEARVVAAFQNVAYEHLLHDTPIECDVLVCGNDRDARTTVLGLARDAGLVAWDAGPIENAVVPEALTSVLININIRNKVKSSGIRVTGVPALAASKSSS
jgi:NADPH-dependent F420 reductase